MGVDGWRREFLNQEWTYFGVGCFSAPPRQRQSFCPFSCSVTIYDLKCLAILKRNPICLYFSREYFFRLVQQLLRCKNAFLPYSPSRILHCISHFLSLSLQLYMYFLMSFLFFPPCILPIFLLSLFFRSNLFHIVLSSVCLSVGLSFIAVLFELGFCFSPLPSIRSSN